jgi:hypothetical protein
MSSSELYSVTDNRPYWSQKGVLGLPEQGIGYIEMGYVPWS